MSDKRKKAKAVEISASNENVLSKRRKRQVKDEINIEQVEKKGKKKTKVVQDSNDEVEDPPSNGHNGSTKDSDVIIIEEVEKKRKKQNKVVQDNNDNNDEVEDPPSNGHNGSTKDSDEIKIVEVEKKKGKKRTKVVQDNNDDVEDPPSNGHNGSTKDSDVIIIEEVDKKRKKKTKVVQDNDDEIEDPPSSSTKDSEDVIPEKRGRKKNKVIIDSKESKVESKNGHKDDVIENGAEKKKGRKKNKASEDNDEPLEELSSQRGKGSAKNKADSKVSENARGAKKAKDISNEPEEVQPSRSRRGRPQAIGVVVFEKEDKNGKKVLIPVLEKMDEPKEELPSKRRKGTAKDKGDTTESVQEKKGRKKTKATPVIEDLPSTSKGRKKPTKDKGDTAENVVEELSENKETTAESDNDHEESTNEEPPVKTRKLPAKKTASSTKKKEPLKNKAATDFTELDFSNLSQTTEGKEWNLKIASWNVDGIRAWLKKGCLEYIKYEKPDIVCLQEVKCPQDKLPEEIVNIPGYHAYWLCSEKDGYAGVGIYTTKLAISVKYGLDNSDLDDEGRIITAEYEQFYLVSTYVPNAGRGLVTLPKRLEWNAAFLDYVKELDKKKPVIICGDMNVAHNEIDLANPKSNKKNAGFTPQERAGMTDLLEAGFVDTYRHIYPDTTGAYTFWTYMMGARAKNVGWRLDYMLVSRRLLPAVCDSVIRNQVYGSDHCPITLLLHLSSAATPKH